MTADTPFNLVPIGSLVQRVKTWNPARDGAGMMIRYIDLGSIDNKAKRIAGCQTLPAIEAPSRARQLVIAGDILVSTVRPNLNGVARVPDSLDGATASTGFCVLRPGDNLEPGYLFHWVRSPTFVNAMVRRATGQSYPAVSDRIVAESEIPLPPLDEQRRIAVVLDHADNLRQMRRTMIERLEEFVSATFNELFAEISDRASETSLGDLFDITRGGSPRPIADYLTDEPDGLNWVSISDATDNGKFIRTVKRRIRPSGGSRSRRVEPGDFLLTNSMSFGRPYIMATTGYIHDGWLSLRPKDDRIDQEYLYRALSSRQTYAKFSRLASGATVKNLNIDLVRTVTIPVPPMAIQNRFADMAKAVDQTVDRAKAHLGHLDALFASLQHRAFSGAL